ncbi:MAG: DNA-processing protein DprA [Patescibacteria group bacterium]|nr:DNA-processing protein DprA [Patescibacteria group bacterium]
MSNEKKYWIAFNFFEGIGPLRFKHLIGFFGSAEKAWNAPKRELLKTNLGQGLIEKFCSFRSQFFPEKELNLEKDLFLAQNYSFTKFAETIFDPERKKQLDWVLKYQYYQKTKPEKPIAVITWKDEQYPKDLKEIPVSPPVLYLIGNIDLLKNPKIAVVGSRKISNYGRQATEKLTAQLVSAGLTIVSGLAYGVDQAAHQAAITNQGKTVAVLGCGVDRIYPIENTDLYRKIAKDHLLVSEFPPGAPPLPGNFPARNRIVAGISKAVLVVEAARKSGALITASSAAEQGKDVFAVPGPITSPVSEGTSWLIQQGAKLVFSADDILGELNLPVGKAAQSASAKTNEAILENLSEKERAILCQIENQPLGFDDIIAKTGISPAETGSLLTIMKIKGIVREVGEGKWAPNI